MSLVNRTPYSVVWQNSQEGVILAVLNKNSSFTCYIFYGYAKIAL